MPNKNKVSKKAPRKSQRAGAGAPFHANPKHYPNFINFQQGGTGLPHYYFDPSQQIFNTYGGVARVEAPAPHVHAGAVFNPQTGGATHRKKQIVDIAKKYHKKHQRYHLQGVAKSLRKEGQSWDNALSEARLAIKHAQA